MFSKLTEPKGFHTIWLPKNTSYYEFKGYVSGVEDVIKFAKGESERIVTGLKCDIIVKQQMLKQNLIYC